MSGHRVIFWKDKIKFNYVIHLNPKAFGPGTKMYIELKVTSVGVTKGELFWGA